MSDHKQQPAQTNVLRSADDFYDREDIEKLMRKAIDARSQKPEDMGRPDAKELEARSMEPAQR